MNEGTLDLNSGLKLMDFLAIGCYLLITFGVAVWFGKKQKTSEDFFVGGRHIPWFAVGLSILATLFSTLSYLGAPGELIKHGIGFYCGYLALPFAMYVVTRLWIPFYMRLGLTSAYEYLEHRFGYGLRCTGAGLFVLLRLGWMSMVVFAASMALDRVKGPDLEILPGPDLYWWMAIIGLVATVYSAVGGIQAQIWTDVLQCLLLLAGAIMVIVAVAFSSGSSPIEWWSSISTQSQSHVAPPLFSWDVTVRVTVLTAMINYFFWTICTHGSDQVVLQRYFSTNSQKAARRSYYISLATELTMVGLLSICGIALLTFYLKNPDALPEGWTTANSADKLFPHFLSHHLPAGCAGLVISAFLCDAIQTLEAGVNSITAVIATDLRRKRNEAGEQPQPLSLRSARILTTAITLFATVNAVFVANIALKGGMTIIDMMPKFFNMFVGPLAAMFIIGMFLPRCTTRSVSVAVVCGITTSVIWNWGREIFGWSSSPTILLAIALPCTVTVVLAAILSFIIERKSPHPGQNYTWSAIVNGPPASQRPCLKSATTSTPAGSSISDEPKPPIESRLVP